MHNKSEIQECVLGGSPADIDTTVQKTTEQEKILMAKKNFLTGYFVFS